MICYVCFIFDLFIYLLCICPLIKLLFIYIFLIIQKNIYIVANMVETLTVLSNV